LIRQSWQSDLPLVLASASSTRARLLTDAGLVFDIVSPDVDEAAFKHQARRDGIGPDGLASILAEAKARKIAGLRAGAIVIGADQVMTAGDEWFDKPATIGQARTQLGRLRGVRQTLHSAVVIVRDGDVLWRHDGSAVVTSRDASDALLDLYVAHEGEALLSSVGALRIEGAGQMLVGRIEGEHSTILGLPMLALLEGLRSTGVLLG
jgi:septum formation protein